MQMRMGAARSITLCVIATVTNVNVPLAADMLQMEMGSHAHSVS